MATPNNLPAQVSSFVGRERQLVDLRRLTRQSRLITLTGPGGAGKTRLALRLGADVLDRHPDGVWLVDLATLDDARLLELTVASACGVREERRRPILELLVEHLGDHRTLLILDSCEHLVEPCAALVENLLQSCPHLTFLVTSREPLGVSGELVWRTPSLTLPRLEDGEHSELLLESEAVRLYVDRARLSQPSLDLTETGSAAVVAQICTRLEGMPLAIELAASLTRVMTSQEILERLSDRFRVLTGGSRSALPRHQTLRKTVDWSYGLLSPDEKALLARLSLFAGGFELAAAEAINRDEASDPHDVLPVLSRLVDKSLVSAEATGSRRTRYRLLDSIREYAVEKLPEPDEAAARRLMARYYVGYCERLAKELRGSNPLPWLNQLDDEQANIRLALSWSLIEMPDDAMRIAAAMGMYWNMRRRLAEGAEWLDRTLELATTNMNARAAALWSRSRVRWWRAEYPGVKVDAEECAILARRLDLPLELHGALMMRGLVSSTESDYGSAERYYQEALEIGRRMTDAGMIARALNNLGMTAMARADYQGAKALLEDAAATIRQSGNRVETSTIYDSLARVYLLLQDRVAARALYGEALANSQRFGDTQYVGPPALEGLALIALAEGDPERALKLIAAAGVIREATGAKALADWKVHLDQGTAAARAKLAGQKAEAAWQVGAAMSMLEAVRYGTGAAPSAPALDGSPLTGRETQVATLIADGLTNPEIAKRLRMAARTADAHVEHIRNKLGLRSRAQIAVWAHERLGRS